MRMDTIFAAIPAAIAVSFLAAREAWRMWAPARHLLAGNYTEARESAEDLEKSWMRVIPGVRTSARYAIASALHLSGDLQGSLDAAAPIPRPHDADTLDAANYVLLDRSPERVAELKAERGEDLLLKALALQSLGKADEALIEKAEATKPTSGHAVTIYEYLRGLYELRAERKPDTHFRIAADGPHANVYSKRARAYFEPPAAEEGPSSLAPQVVAKPAS